MRVGVVILFFFGIAFLAKYASETFTAPVEVRLAGIAAGGIAPFPLRWRLRFARPGDGLTLQDGGIGMLDLTVFAALRRYGVLPAPLAFTLRLSRVAASAVLAVRQQSLALARLGASDGFLAPSLASTGRGSHVPPFGDDLGLDVAILWASPGRGRGGRSTCLGSRSSPPRYGAFASTGPGTTRPRSRSSPPFS